MARTAYLAQGVWPVSKNSILNPYALCQTELWSQRNYGRIARFTPLPTHHFAVANTVRTIFKTNATSTLDAGDSRTFNALRFIIIRSMQRELLDKIA